MTLRSGMPFGQHQLCANQRQEWIAVLCSTGTTCGFCLQSPAPAKEAPSINAPETVLGQSPPHELHRVDTVAGGSRTAPYGPGHWMDIGIQDASALAPTWSF